MSSRRKQHRLAYYITAIHESEDDPDKLMELLDDAAKQPKKVIGDEDYERIFWLVYGKDGYT